MNPITTINAAIIGVNALLEVITHLKGEAGLSDDELAAMFAAHGEATKSAIAGYLAALPK